MNQIIFNLENKEYIVELTKQLKQFSINPYSKYDCCINFKNLIGQNVVSIHTSEKQILSCIESLNNFANNVGYEYSDVIYFDNSTDTTNYFWYTSFIPAHNNPVDEDDENMCISIYSSSIQGNVLRIYLEMSYTALEDLIYQLYLLIEDIPYLYQMSTDSLGEYLYEQGITF